jgi:hypothetical protein
LRDRPAVEPSMIERITWREVVPLCHGRKVSTTAMSHSLSHYGRHEPWSISPPSMFATARTAARWSRLQVQHPNRQDNRRLVQPTTQHRGS